MDVSNKNIIYTYVPPLIDWEFNKDFYLIDLISMIYSVILFKKKFKYKKLILYTSTELKVFFDNNNYFDEVIDIEYNKKYFESQITGICPKNTLFKLFVASKQTEPFIHIDIDFIINDENLFSIIKKPIFFSFIENVMGDESAKTSDGYYQIYFNTFKKTINILNEDEWKQMGNFNTSNAVNCSIFGSDDNSLCISFKRTWDFLINNNEKLMKIENINLALEQYYQFSYLLEEKSFYNDISTLDKILASGYVSNSEYDEQILNCDDYEKLNKDTYLIVKNHFTKSQAIHLSGIRFKLYYKVLICNLLNEMDINILNNVKNSFGNFKWMNYEIK
jgi:hypothetical protein